MKANLISLTESEYHADKIDPALPTLSASIAKILVEKTPAHAYARHPRLGGTSRPSTPAMDRGHIIHAILSGEEPNVNIIDAADFKRQWAREQRDAAVASGMIPVLSHKIDALRERAGKLSEALDVAGFKAEGGTFEQTVVWTETSSLGPVLCRGRMDYFIESTGSIFDFKTVENAHPDACAAHMIRYGSAIQEAAYTSAITKLLPALAGRVSFQFLFCETEEPFAVLPATSAGSMRQLGESRWMQAVEIWARCQKNNHWPGYAPTQLHAPSWAVAQAMENEANEQ